MKGRHNKITSLAQNLIVCMLLRRKVINFIKSYQSIRHCLHAHVQIHEVLIVTSRMIHTHFRLQAEQKAVAVTCKTTKLINKDKKVLLLIIIIIIVIITIAIVTITIIIMMVYRIVPASGFRFYIIKL